MGDCSCTEVPDDPRQLTPGYRRALWIVVILNLGYGIIEAVAGFFGHSQALKADALDSSAMASSASSTDRAAMGAMCAKPSSKAHLPALEDATEAASERSCLNGCGINSLVVSGLLSQALG